MSKKEKNPEEQKEPLHQDPDTKTAEAEAAQPEATAEEVTTEPAADLGTLKHDLAEQEDKFLRLAAEYDNYRRRSQKEKESAWADSKADTVLAFLPVYDNLERALAQETADEAYKKGVEMIMSQFRDTLAKLGVTEIPSKGQPFDPNFHNAVMHVDDDSVGENTIVDVFQAGFQAGDKVIRFAMVKVAN